MQFRSLIGTLQTGRSCWSWCWRRFISIPHRYPTNFLVGALNDADRIFRSLIGTLQTGRKAAPTNIPGLFRSLIGTLQTDVPAGRRECEDRFRSLIGTLQTHTACAGKKSVQRISIPHRYPTNPDTDRSALVFIEFRSLIGTLQTWAHSRRICPKWHFDPS